MDKVLYVLGYLNETHGFDLVYPESVLKYREEEIQIEIVVNRGIAGCPKFLIPYEVIDKWIASHADDPVEDTIEIEDDEGFEDDGIEAIEPIELDLVDEATEEDDVEVVDPEDEIDTTPDGIDTSEFEGVNPENDEEFEDESDVLIEIDEPEDLTDLPGVGPKLEEALNTAGVHGVYDFMHGNSEYLLAIPGMSVMKLKRILEHIAEEERADND